MPREVDATMKHEIKCAMHGPDDIDIFRYFVDVSSHPWPKK